MLKYKTVKLFPLHVGVGSLQLSEEIRKVFINEIDNQEDWPLDRPVSWTGDVNDHSNLHKNEVFKPLFDLVPSAIKEYCEELGMKSEAFDFYITRAWGTKSLPHQVITKHNHAYASLSFVYYPYIPEKSSGITIHDSHMHNQVISDMFGISEKSYDKVLKSDFSGVCNSAMLPVATDNYVIMPAKTDHGTQVSGKWNALSEARYSVAVDVLMTLKESDNVEQCLPPVKDWALI